MKTTKNGQHMQINECNTSQWQNEGQKSYAHLSICRKNFTKCSIFSWLALSRKLFVAAHIYNPRDLGGRQEKVHSLRPVQGGGTIHKTSSQPVTSNKLGVLVCTSHPSDRSISRKITVQSSLDKKQNPISKITGIKKGWKCGKAST
jgi:hypothetical protein